MGMIITYSARVQLLQDRANITDKKVRVLLRYKQGSLINVDRRTITAFFEFHEKEVFRGVTQMQYAKQVYDTYRHHQFKVTDIVPAEFWWAVRCLKRFGYCDYIDGNFTDKKKRLA
jgi:hypothetical protein